MVAGDLWLVPESGCLMRMLFVCRPGYGHILPLLPIASAARSAGHELLFATGPDVTEVAAAQGFEAVSVGLDSGAEIRDALAAEKPARGDIRKFVFTRFFAGRELEPRLRDLEAKCLPRRPDVILHDIADLAAPVAAAVAKVPLVSVGFGPLLDPTVADAAGMAGEASWRSRGLKLPKWAGMYRDLYVDPCPPMLQVPAIAELPAVQQLGPGQLEWTTPPDWIGEVKAPLVYVTFGTVFNRDHTVFRRVLEALARLPVEVVVTVGKNNDPAAFGPQPKTTRIFQFVPQNTLLPHCRAVVAHGGAGTFLGALAHGIPLLFMPQSADQFYNASRAVAAGAALSLTPEHASVEAIAGAVARILGDPAIAAAAQGAAKQLAAMPGPAEVVTRIERMRG